MQKITITLYLYNEFSDKNDETGLTEEAYLELSGELSSFGEIVDIERAE